MRAAPHQIALVDRAKSGAIVTAVFHPSEPVDKAVPNRFRAHDAENAAHSMVRFQSRKYNALPFSWLVRPWLERANLAICALLALPLFLTRVLAIPRVMPGVKRQNRECEYHGRDNQIG